MSEVHLHVDDRELASCVACGLCLPHCPTYRVTGEESASPRGRIAAMRAVEWEHRPLDGDFTTFMDLCVQCRACEAVCPSSVPFGRLMEGARETLVDETNYQPRRWRLAYATLGHHRLLLAGSTVLAAAQRVGLVPRRLGLGRVPLQRQPLRATGADVWLFTGCVMDAWQRPVHQAVIDVLGRGDIGVALPGKGADCCGALHVHAGLADGARRLARRVLASMPGDAPILVDSAGCGAALKDYGRLLDTDEARAFAARVFDVHEWLAQRVDRLPKSVRRLPYRVAVQDPCHLRHVQRTHQHVRTVLAPYADLVELDDEGLCCGAGGAYAATHPEMAGDLRERKVEAVRRTGASVVASANPGCIMHLQAAGLDVRHPLELIAEALRGG
ncbi:MAG: (Fe-S)-binding protein [Acidimicrobiia bacterium]|nr:(Fe-S)-binding protein [Acidimicrobiia bacterium]